MQVPIWYYGLAAILAYLIGAFPTAYLVAKQVKGIDIREHGSGNAGATNVWRVVGKKYGIFVLLTDFFKGLLPVVVARVLFPEEAAMHVMIAVLTVFGHSRSVFLQFTGGKSAITGLGGMMALAPQVALILGIVAFTIIKLGRIVSVGSMVAAVLAPILLVVLDYRLPYIIYGLLSAVYVVYLHRSNIQRLLKGTENRI